MAISVIIGKPGSGKSYFAVSKLAEYFCDWARYEEKNGERFPRRIYTNLELAIDEIDKYVVKKTGINFDSSYYLVTLDESFFYSCDESGARTPKEWWEGIENKALIVIDEVHQYLPSIGTGGKNYMQLFSEYAATHRHREQDLILITQHTDTLHKSVLCMAGDAYHIANIKGRVIPFLHIPFADLDVVKEAWGCNTQVANVIYGNYLGKSFKQQSINTFVLLPEIYALYQSHTMAGGESVSDRPSLNLSRTGAVFWFLRRHGLHLGVKAVIVSAVAYGIWWVLAEMPGFLSENLVKTIKVAPTMESKGEVPGVTSGRVVVDGSSDLEKQEKTGKSSSEKREKNENASLLQTDIVYVYGPNYIVTSAGRVAVGGFIYKDGRPYVLREIDYKNRCITTSITSGVPVGSYNVP